MKKSIILGLFIAFGTQSVGAMDIANTATVTQGSIVITRRDNGEGIFYIKSEEYIVDIVYKKKTMINPFNPNLNELYIQELGIGHSDPQGIRGGQWALRAYNRVEQEFLAAYIKQQTGAATAASSSSASSAAAAAAAPGKEEE